MLAESSPYSVSPDWLLLGGYRGLVVWRDDTRESIVTRSVKPVGFALETETRPLGDGTLDDLSRVRSVAPEVASWPAVVALRRWAAEVLEGAEPRVLVRAVLIGGRSPHLLWDEPVPVLLRAFNEGRGTLSGDRLVLHSARYDAAIESSPDLLGTPGVGDAWEGSAERVLPAPGLTIVSDTATVEALDRGGAVVGSAPPGEVLTLPGAVWSVRVTAGARPALVVRRPPPPAPPVVAAQTALTHDGEALTHDGAVLTYSD